MTDESAKIGKILSILSSRENRVIREMYGIETDRLTPEEIARNLPRQTMGTSGEFVGLSRSRVLGIASTALRKLRNAEPAHLLELIVESGNAPAGVLDLSREVLPPKAGAEANIPLPEPEIAQPPGPQKGKLIIMRPR